MMAEPQRAGSLKFFFIGIVCWNLAVSIDSTALSVALPTISQQLNATSTEAFWCGTAFTLCSAAFQPIYASFSDAFGRKPMLLTALTLFTAGSVICGVAHHITVLLVGRSVQGAGGGGLLTMTYVLMTDSLSLQERHKAITALSLTWLVGTVVGPIMSGGFTEHASWRLIFWLNLPFCVLSYVVIIFFIKTSYVPSQSRLQGLRNIDWLGSVTFVGSITSFLIPLSWGGTMYAWSSWHTYVPLAVGSAGLILWLLYSMFLRKQPMIPLSIMANRTAALHYLGNLVHGIVQFGGLYYLPLYYQTVLSYSPTISGVAMLAQCVIAAPFSAVAAIVIAKTNSVKPLILTSWVCLTVGCAVFNFLEPDTSIPKWIALNIPSAMGIGSLFGGLALATQAAAEVSGTRSAEEVRKIRGMAASLNPFFRTLGQALGIVIAQAAFTNQMKHRAGQQLASDAASLGQVIQQYPKDSPQRIALVNDYNDSLHTVWYVLCGLAGVMLLLTLCVKDIGPKGENAGFLGFGGLKAASSTKDIKVVRTQQSMSVLLDDHKQAAWGIRERVGSGDSLGQASEMQSPISSSGSSTIRSYAPSHLQDDDKEITIAHPRPPPISTIRPRDSYASLYSPRMAQSQSNLLSPSQQDTFRTSTDSSAFPNLLSPRTPELQQGGEWQTHSPALSLVREATEPADMINGTSMMVRGPQMMDSVTSSVLEEMMREDDERHHRQEAVAQSRVG